MVAVWSPAGRGEILSGSRRGVVDVGRGSEGAEESLAVAGAASSDCALSCAAEPCCGSASGLIVGGFVPDPLRIFWDLAARTGGPFSDTCEPDANMIGEGSGSLPCRVEELGTGGGLRAGGGSCDGADARRGVVPLAFSPDCG